MTSYTDSAGQHVETGATYALRRGTAERLAAKLAAECVIKYGRDSTPAHQAERGRQFVAVAGCDQGGPWHFALDYESAEDRADVDAFIGGLA